MVSKSLNYFRDFGISIGHNCMMTEKPTCRVNFITIFIGLYLIWSCLNLLLPGRQIWFDAVWRKWLVLVFIYVLVLSTARKRWVLWMVVSAGVVQALYAIGQQAGYIASNHHLFPITGLMGNPGQMGGFQAVAFLSAALLAVKTPNRRLKIFLLFPFLSLLFYSLWLADSRAGWVAVGIGLLVLFHVEIRRVFSQRHWLVVPIILVTILSVVALYAYRSESAQSRLLIWRVTMDMIADKPLSGFGAGGFNQQYMLYQARYFETHPDSEFLMVADNAAYPYNEFLHVFVEQGIIGLLLFLGIFVAAYWRSTDKRMLVPLIGLLVFSLFSYPSYKFGLVILFPVLLGSIECARPRIANRQFRFGVITALVATIIFISTHQVRFEREVRLYARRLTQEYDKNAADFISNNFRRLSTDVIYNSLYASWMVTYPEMADESKFCMVMPSCENWCDIGDIYMNSGRYIESEECYRTASYMIPTRLLPNYRLWKLYLLLDEHARAKRVADRILTQPIKFENTFTLRVKTEVRNYYANYPIHTKLVHGIR